MNKRRSTLFTGSSATFTAIIVPIKANKLTFWLTPRYAPKRPTRSYSPPECLTFLALPYFFVEDGFAKLAELPYNSHERRNLASYGLTIAFFYLNFYVLISRPYFKRSYVLYGLSVLGYFLLVQAILANINHQPNFFPPGRCFTRFVAASTPIS
ncbi:hypothetical protein ACFSUS_07675 [Spirosoma soli]|uniref:Uncharacterized protein n=1 Tax=Spirosoma soli TaxID=1770529 RepID=A0ABW5M2Y6_9BACT